MFPSKSTGDYMNELTRLFPKSEPIESKNISQNYYSPFQTPIANKSSSSAESVSPESFSDIPFYRQTEHLPRNRCETSKPSYFGSSTNIHEPKNTFESALNMCRTSMSPKSSYGSPNLNMSPTNVFDRQIIYESRIYETPIDSLLEAPKYSNTEIQYPIRRQRPIIGRKILGSSQQIQKNDNEIDMWHFEASQTPERSPKSYELFPMEETRDFPTSMKKIIPQYKTPSIPYIQNPYNSVLQQNPQYSSVDSIGTNKLCTFCRKNGETPIVFMTHCVKEKIGNRYVVTCPILRSHKCSTCGASGDDAHTITYCPVLRRSNNGKPLQSTTITLKNTRLKSNGRKRF